MAAKKVRSRFTVRGPQYMFVLGLMDIICMVFAVVLQVTGNHEPVIVMSLVFAPFMIPGIIAILLAKVFCVKVKGHEISVRTYMGRKYQFDISEVEHIKWKKTINGIFTTEQIKIRTRSGKKVTVDDLMDGFGYMAAFVSEYVEASKIENRIIVLKPPSDEPPALWKERDRR